MVISIRLMGYTQLCGWLDIMFLNIFQKSMTNMMKKVIILLIRSLFDEKKENLSDDVNDYYLSWLLRSDSPLIGSELASENLTILHR